MEISISGYHSWQRRLPLGRQQQDLLLAQQIHVIHQRRKQRYGAPRIHADLQADGQRVSRKRVARLMRAAGLRAKGTRKFVKTTDSDHADPVSPNLLARHFDVPQPNHVWASDLTYIPTKEGWLYLAVTIDLHSRAVVGYAMDTSMPATLPSSALRMAAVRRHPPTGLLHHSDRGSQYTSKLFQAELAYLGAISSMSRRPWGRNHASTRRRWSRSLMNWNGWG